MTTQTTYTGSPTLPRVNLLPPEIGEARRLQQYRFGAAGAVGAAFVVVGALYWHAHGGVASAQSGLDAANARTATLQSQVTQYQSVTQVRAQVDSAKATLATALQPQILWSHYLEDMSVSLAGNYWFASMTMASNGTGTATGTVTATPFGDPSAIGSVTLQGHAVSHFDVADLLRDLAKERGLSHPVVSSSSEDATPTVGDHRLVSFTISVPVDSSAKPASATAPPTTNKAAG